MMTAEEAQALLHTAQNASSLNTILLGFIAVLIMIIGGSARAFATRTYSQFEEMLKEIQNIKIDVATHDEAIENLKTKNHHR